MPGTTRTKRPPRASAASSVTSYRGSETPSLLNGAGSGKSIPIIGSQRSSTGQASTSSPPQSRSSSAEGSYSTSATTFEDTEETTRGRSRDGADNMPESNRNSRNKEIKGNVIVSVRVRPDVSGQDPSRAEGEWMVDGRRSLVAYRGKEGGDYHYGEFKCRNALKS
jgi:centromeric protein E